MGLYPANARKIPPRGGILETREMILRFYVEAQFVTCRTISTCCASAIEVGSSVCALCSIGSVIVSIETGVILCFKLGTQVVARACSTRTQTCVYVSDCCGRVNWHRSNVPRSYERGRCGRVSTVCVVVELKRELKLLDVGHSACIAALLAGAIERGEDDRRKDTYDCNHDQEFYQCKTRVAVVALKTFHHNNGR